MRKHNSHFVPWWSGTGALCYRPKLSPKLSRSKLESGVRWYVTWQKAFETPSPNKFAQDAAKTKSDTPSSNFAVRVCTLTRCGGPDPAAHGTDKAHEYLRRKAKVCEARVLFSAAALVGWQCRSATSAISLTQSLCNWSRRTRRARICQAHYQWRGRAALICSRSLVSRRKQKKAVEWRRIYLSPSTHPAPCKIRGEMLFFFWEPSAFQNDLELALGNVSFFPTLSCSNTKLANMKYYFFVSGWMLI